MRTYYYLILLIGILTCCENPQLKELERENQLLKKKLESSISFENESFSHQPFAPIVMTSDSKYNVGDTCTLRYALGLYNSPEIEVIIHSSQEKVYLNENYYYEEKICLTDTGVIEFNDFYEIIINQDTLELPYSHVIKVE